jgi:hypothetical protein
MTGSRAKSHGTFRAHREETMVQIKRKHARHSLKRAIVAGAAAVTILSGALHTVALADDDARISELMFDVSGSILPSTIDVTSSDGKKWDTIAPGHVVFSAHMKVDTAWPGYVDQVGVFLGNCNNQQCGNGYPLLFHATPASRDYDQQTTISFSTSIIPISTSGIAVVPYGDQILNACNAHLQSDGATASHSFSKPMTVSFSVNTRTGAIIAPTEVSDPALGPYFDGGETTRQGSFSVNVVCKPFLKTVNDVAAEVPQELKVGTIELFRSTYTHATSQPDPATVCKKARWLVRLNTNKIGPVRFKLWTKVGEAPMTSKVIDAWAAHDGPGEYKAEYAEWTEVTKTSVVQAMAEDMTNTFGQSTGWKDITLHCTGVGGGGFADAPRPNPDEPVTQPLKVTGDLALADQAGAPKDKPRLGQAVFKILASKPGNTSYRLTCTGRRQWEGSLPTAKVGEYKYQAVGAHNFQIDKTEQIGCALRSTSLPKHNVIAVASELFKLVKGNPDVARPGGKAIRPPATHAAPHRLVGQAGKTPPRISCIGGRSTGTACFCKTPTVKVQTGPNAYRCVMDGMATGRRTAPFARPAESRPQFLVGPARAPRAQTFARPTNRESSLPRSPFIR